MPNPQEDMMKQMILRKLMESGQMGSPDMPPMDQNGTGQEAGGYNVPPQMPPMPPQMPPQGGGMDPGAMMGGGGGMPSELMAQMMGQGSVQTEPSQNDAMAMIMEAIQRKMGGR